MAAFDTTRPVAALNGGYFSKAFATAFASVIAWNDARVTRKALAKLTDRELDDIGLNRGDLGRIESLIR